VEPGEIENRLTQLGDLKHCVVLGRANQRGEKSLVAFFIPKTAVEKAADTLKSDLKKHVPDYMVPDLFLELTELPMTPNGKIDHKKLLEIAQSRPVQKVEKAHQEPISPTVEKLVDLFQSILDQDQLGPDDDFFELGGHSLRAVSLMTQIQQQLGIQLPLSSLISCPTPRLLGACIEGDQTDQFWQCMVPIRPEGDKMPLYLIHGAGLNVLLYQSLGNHLDKHRPIFAMQAKGLDGKTELSTSIEEMAADYVAEIRKNQPNGPYALFGFSLGGFIAFEMARQLLDQNQKIAFLGVIDTVTTFAQEELTIGKKLLAILENLFAKPAFLIVAFCKEPNAEKMKFVKQKLKNFKFTLLYYFSRVGLYRLKQASETASDGTPVYLSSKAAVVIDTALNVIS
jgi:pimeloyl-ACP methyl ester carboxylesterase